MIMVVKSQDSGGQESGLLWLRAIIVVVESHDDGG